MMGRHAGEEDLMCLHLQICKEKGGEGRGLERGGKVGWPLLLSCLVYLSMIVEL